MCVSFASLLALSLNYECQLRSAYMGMAMMAFLHGYMKFTQPLFVQGIMGLKGVYEAIPVKVHILGKKAEGDLKRPWKAAGGMFGCELVRRRYTLY